MASASTPITLQFAARNLPSADVLGSSDPMLIVYKLSPKVPGFGFKPEKGNFTSQELFRTARIKNNLNPSWDQVMQYEYVFEQEQWLFLQVLDIDAKHNASVEAQDFLGGVTTTVGRIVSGQNNGWFTMQLLNKKQQPLSVKNQPSNVLVKTTVLPKVIVNYKLKATFNLEVTRFMKSDTPFMQVLNAAGQVVHETRKAVGKVGNYDTFQLSGNSVNPSVTFRLQHNHEDAYIGEAVLTEQQLANLPVNSSIVILDKKKKRMGTLVFEQVEVVRNQEEVKGGIVQHLNDGNSISAIVAIDFTGSNGDPSHPHSLHYLGGLNKYKQAIMSVIPILDQYDSDGKYPVYGYGMVYPGRQVDHAKLFTEEATYADGVSMTYENIIHEGGFALSGPTYFAPVIEEAIRRATNPKAYQVLVIFTDGAINDMDATIDAIIRASYLPMSIIIVGIGDGDFGSMTRLDNDGAPPLRSARLGKAAKRDIVQFVPLRECRDSQTLQAATLAELPGQILEFYRS